MRETLAVPRIGFVVPAPALVIRHELGRLLPDSVELVFAEVEVPAGTPDAILTMLDREFDAAIETLDSAGCDVVVQAGVGPSVVLGPGEDRQLGDRIRARARRAVVAMEATLAALDALGAKRLAVVAPLSEEMMRRIKAYFEGHGFSVPATAAHGLVSADDVHHADEAGAQKLARNALESAPDADCLYIFGGGWPSLNIIEPLRHESGRPVLSSNLATTWVLHRLLDLQPSSVVVSGFTAEVESRAVTN